MPDTGQRVCLLQVSDDLLTRLLRASAAAVARDAAALVQALAGRRAGPQPGDGGVTLQTSPANAAAQWQVLPPGRQGVLFCFAFVCCLTSTCQNPAHRPCEAGAGSRLAALLPTRERRSKPVLCMRQEKQAAASANTKPQAQARVSPPPKVASKGAPPSLHDEADTAEVARRLPPWFAKDPLAGKEVRCCLRSASCPVPALADRLPSDLQQCTCRFASAVARCMLLLCS